MNLSFQLNLKNSLGLIILLFSLGFAKDGIIELESYLNGRSSANFLKETKNVKFTLPPGTRAKIQASKKFSSGNYGLQVEVTSGPHKGESVWVYYRNADPGIKLFGSDDAAKKDQESKDIEKARVAKTTREHPVIREVASEPLKIPALAPVSKLAFKEVKKASSEAAATIRGTPQKLEKAEVAEVVRRVEKANTTLQKQGSADGPCSDCELAKVYATNVSGSATKEATFAPRTSQDAPLIIPPTRTQNHNGIRPIRCRTLPGDIDSCTYEGDSEPGKFKLRNRGPNKTVSAGNSGRMREWGFDFEGKARQDLGLAISDMPNGTVSQTQESYIMVFPRKSLPTIRTVGNRQIVTLPTGETVTFDLKTKQVIGGVLSEDGAMTEGGKTLQPAKVSYRGNGVMVRVDVRGDEPRLKSETATITKQGKICRVPTKKLWPDRSERSAAHFKYFSDSDFDAFLKSTCGFGL